MVLAGAEQLGQHAEHVNSLNVFPVPDGDTGTNMNLTMSAGVAEIKEKVLPPSAKLPVFYRKACLWAHGEFRSYSVAIVPWF